MLRLTALIALSCLILPNVTYGQPLPRLTVITPPGGQAGTTVTVTLTGVDLEGCTNLLISPSGLTAERTINPAKKGEFLPNQFTIKIPKEIQPGFFDLRAVNSFGITNPRTFVVGELVEHQEKEPNNDVPQAQSMPLNSTMNGVIQSPADVDYFSVACKQGDNVLVQVAAESIDSRLEPDIRVYHASGKQLAANRARAEPDGFCQFIAPADGVYYIRLCAHAHVEGSAESFYRLSVSTRPWIESLYPNVVEPGKAASAMLWGRNLPGATTDQQFKVSGQPLQKLNVTLAPPSDTHASQRILGWQWVPPYRAGLDGYYYRVKNANGWSNSVPVSYVYSPLIMEALDHTTAARAQTVPVPCEIMGRIEKANDRDWYSFTGKAGEELVIEGFAERVGVPIDLYFELRRENGTVVGEYDENPDQSNYHRFFARTDDPSAKVTLPADGKYHLMVSSRDATLRGDPRLSYRISMHKPRPDFRAVLVDAHPQNPGSLRLVPGSRQHADIILFRKDGFTGQVTISVDGLPAGVTCTSAIVPARSVTGALVLTADSKATEFSGAITIKATATIDGQIVTREVRSGCLVWPNPNEQNNGPGISRLCRSTVLAVRAGQPPFRLNQTSESIALPAGSNQTFKIKVDRLWPEAKVPINLTGVLIPAGITVNNNQPLAVPADKNEIDVRLLIQANTTIEQFPLVLRGVAAVPYAKDPKAKQKPAVQMAETTNVCMVTVYRKVADLIVDKDTIEIKQAGEVTIPIKINRLHQYQGPVNIQVQGLPRGISAATVVVPEKAVEGKLVIKAAKNAAESKATGLTLRSSGTVSGITLNSDTKLSLKVTK